VQSQILKSSLPLRTWFACCAALVAFAGSTGDAGAAQALVNAEVPAAKWKAIRLKNLPQGTKVSIQVESRNGGLDVIFIHGDELKRFPAAVSPEFQGSVERKLSFSAVVAKKGDYYIILDNRQGSEARKARLLIKAERGNAPEGSTAPGIPSKKKSDPEI
jgi:hypothetical protein